MIAIGSQVFVRWYGSILQGEVVTNTTPDDKLLGRMSAVRIPLQGGQAIALFSPGHVYTSVDQMQQVSKEVYSCPAHFPKPEEIVHSEPHASVFEVASPVIKKLEKAVSPAWQRLQDYKSAHWDEEHNRLQIDALEGFYSLWRDSVADKLSASVPDGLPSVRKNHQQIERKANKITQLSFNF